LNDTSQSAQAPPVNNFISVVCLLFLFELTLHVFQLRANMMTMGIFTDECRIKFTFSRADRLSIGRAALIVKRSAKLNGWDCKQWRMMSATTGKKINFLFLFCVRGLSDGYKFELVKENEDLGGKFDRT
jgi:hypothetical protein